MPTINPPLEEMTVEEKLQLMEAVWQSLTRNPDEYESPAWHGEVLRETQRQIDAGETHFLSWEEAQREIDRRLELRRAAKAVSEPR